MDELRKGPIVFFFTTPSTPSHNWLREYFLSTRKSRFSEKKNSMTYEQLICHFNRTFEKKDTWPLTYEVDSVTYANVCHGIFTRKLHEKSTGIEFEGYTLDMTAFLPIAVGPHGGIKLRNIELILKEEK